MGGQASLFSSSGGNASAYDIRAAVLHHAYTHSFPAPTVPVLVFTGEEDTVSPAKTMAFPIIDVAAEAGCVHGLVDKTRATHHEPDITSLDTNGIALLAQFSVAWMKIHLDLTPQAYGIDFAEMIYGSRDDAVCGGGDGDMTQCTIEAVV
jgi:hypothetical protein